MNFLPYSRFDFDHPPTAEIESRGMGARIESPAEAIVRQIESAKFSLGIAVDYLALVNANEIEPDELKATADVDDDDETPLNVLRERVKLEIEVKIARLREELGYI